MFCAGVVAEYDPFHNGHKYHLEQTRKLGAQRIVVVMSGDAVQRGEIAAFSKYKRAQLAIAGGADLVIELSAPYSCAPAQVFAENAIRLFAGLGEGVVEAVSFGSVDADAKSLENAASLCRELENSESVKQLTSSGVSYPAAVAKAAQKYSPQTASILAEPNNVLAVEYIKAAAEIAPWIKPLSVQRVGALHSDTAPNGSFASATVIRQMLRHHEDVQKYVPYCLKDTPAELHNQDRALLMMLLSADEKRIAQRPFVNQSIVNRYLKAMQKCPETISEFAQLIKSRDMTMSRVRRLIMHILLDITHSDMTFPVPYGRILALNEKGAQILAHSQNKTLCYDTSLKNLERTAEGTRTAMTEKCAVRLRELCSGEPFSNEYTKKIVLTK